MFPTGKQQVFLLRESLFFHSVSAEHVNVFPTEGGSFFTPKKLIRAAAAYETMHQNSAKLCSLFTVHCSLTRAPLAPCHLFTCYLKKSAAPFSQSDCFLFSVYCFFTRAPLALCHLFTCYLSPEKISRPVFTKRLFSVLCLLFPHASSARALSPVHLLTCHLRSKAVLNPSSAARYNPYSLLRTFSHRA